MIGFFDSGSYRHLTWNKDTLKDAKSTEGCIYAANKEEMKVVAEGTVGLEPSCYGGTLDVKKVQLIPGLAANLLSVGKIVDKDYTVTFKKQGCVVTNADGECVATGCRSNGLFKLEQRFNSAMACQKHTQIEL